jgi:hypothetical protein
MIEDDPMFDTPDSVWDQFADPDHPYLSDEERAEILAAMEEALMSDLREQEG